MNMAANVYEYERGGKCVYIFRYTYAGIRIVTIQIKKRNRHLSRVMRTSRAPWQRNLLKLMLRWGWVFLERTRILNGIQFTTHFIKKIVVETKRFVSSFVHVILTRQTCGQRSRRAAERKRRAPGNYFSERICYMFLISKCRETEI